MSRECNECGGELMRSVVADPQARGTTHREQYTCLNCGSTQGGGQFK
jgi:hypothetical protein